MNIVDKIDTFIFEMANIPSRVHKLKIDVKFNVLQPGNKVLNHDPRIKVFQKMDLYNCYYINLKGEITIDHIPKKEFLSTKQLKKIIKHFEINQDAYLKLWHTTAMTVDEFEELLK